MNSFFLLAGGFGKRVKPLSNFYPKPLFPLNGIPLIQRMIDKLFGYGLKRGFINVHYKAERLRNSISSTGELVFFYEEKLSGNKILKQAYNYLNEEYILVVNGDIYLEIPLPQMVEKIKKYDGDCLVLVKESKDNTYRHLIVHNHRLVRRGKKNDSEKDRINLFCGVLILKKKLLNVIDEENIFNFLKKKKLKTIVFFHHGLWLDIGTPHLYFKADQTIRMMENNRANNSISRGVCISKDSEVFNSIIWQNSIINKSKIKNSIVMENLSINNIECTSKIILPHKNGIKFLDLE